MELPVNKIICGDCLEVLPTLPKAKMIFADPPDNLGLKYNGFADKIPSLEYNKKLFEWLAVATELSKTVWFSIYYKYLPEFLFNAKGCGDTRLFIWRYTFGQHRNTDCGNGFRPLVRILNSGATFYPDEIREPSKRQTLYNDKRANPKGRVPDDVWEFPRVCGTFNERRRWHPNQHPEALIERIVKFSCVPGDLVIDMFAGTGTVNRVCKRLGIDCIGIEISKFYCEQITKEQGQGALFE
jgi:DNA modification methylase